MSDPIDPATIGVALDEAEANGLHPEFTALLKAMVGKADLLERAVVLLERRIKSIGGLMPIRPPATGHPEVALVAEHRGETPAATLARLSPNPHPFEAATTPVRPRDGRPFTEAEMEEIRNLGRPRIDPRVHPLPVRQPVPADPSVDWTRVRRGDLMTRNPDGTYRPFRPGDIPDEHTTFHP